MRRVPHGSDDELHGSDGSSEKETVDAGSLGCGDGNVHAAENLEDAAEFIIIEFKDRKTFRNK
jgi:hypothetical protein